MIVNRKVGSIRQIQQQLKRNDFDVSEYALRFWVKTGKIPAKFSGKKALILYEDVLAFLGDTTSHVSAGLS